MKYDVIIVGAGTAGRCVLRVSIRSEAVIKVENALSILLILIRQSFNFMRFVSIVAVS